MKREHMGMAVVEANLTQKEIERRKEKLVKQVPPLRSFQLQKRQLLVVGSLFKSMTESWAAGVTFGDVLEIVNECIKTQLRTMGHTGKIEFPSYPESREMEKIVQAAVDFNKWQAKRDRMYTKAVKRYKVQATKCLGKSRKKCPKCKKSTLKRWPSLFGNTYLLCSRCGWTNRPVEKEAFKTVAEKIRAVLEKSFPPPAVIKIEPGFRDNLHVRVNSDVFKDRSEKYKCDLLWKVINGSKELTNKDRAKISLLHCGDLSGE